MVIQRTVIQKMGKQIISPILLALGLMSSSVWAQNAAAVIAEAARNMGEASVYQAQLGAQLNATKLC